MDLKDSSLEEHELPRDLFAVLSSYLTPARRDRMKAVAAKRLPWLRCVLQDVHGEHNISACLRSCEAFGVGGVDILSLLPLSTRSKLSSSTSKGSFAATSVACGISDWLQIQTYDDLEIYQKLLRQNNFRLYAGVPASHQQLKPQSLPEMVKDASEQKFNLAVLFGNEREGIHPDWHAYLDGAFAIETSGFVESLNVSVAVAVTLHYLLMEAQCHDSDHFLYLSDHQVQHQLGIWLTKKMPHWKDLYAKKKKSDSRSSGSTLL